ncbi:MAG: MFS transporter [Thermomicrobiales bacterium]
MTDQSASPAKTGNALTAQRLLKRNTRFLYHDMGWQGLITGGISTFLAFFLVRLGASALLGSLLTSLPALITLALSIPLVPLIERHQNLVRVVTWTRVGSRFCFLLIALVPLVLTGARLHAAPVLIALIWGLSAVFSAATTPAFTAVLAAVVPPRLRPMVNGQRWALFSLVTALSSAAFGRLLDVIPFPWNFQGIFLLSFLAGLVSIFFFDRIRIPPENHTPPPPRATNPLRAIAALARESAGQPAFTAYLLTTFVYRLGLSLPVALFPLYWVDHLHASNTWIGFNTTACYGMLVVAYVAWGRVANRYGYRTVLLWSSFGSSFYPLLTSLVPSPIWMIPVAMVYGTFAAGIDISFFEGLLEASPPEQRASFAAVNASFANLAVLVGPLAGTAVADWLGIRAGFIAAGGLCLAGTALFYVLASGGGRREPQLARAE